MEEWRLSSRKTSVRKHNQITQPHKVNGSSLITVILGFTWADPTQEQIRTKCNKNTPLLRVALKRHWKATGSTLTVLTLATTLRHVDTRMQHQDHGHKESWRNADCGWTLSMLSYSFHVSFTLLSGRASRVGVLVSRSTRCNKAQTHLPFPQKGIAVCFIGSHCFKTVSYTHLTLPTKA